jgi:hypothetical protein
VLLLLFGALMLVVGIRMLRSGEPTAQSQQCRPLRCLATGVAVAQRCEPCNSRHCPVCRGARCRRRGAAFWLVKKIEARLCPFCRAYERVYGRKAHERRPHKDPYLQDTN